MAKRLMVLVGMLAVMLAMAVPAVAQQGSEPVKLTGMIQSLPGSGGPPVFSITDEASGERYILDAGEGANYSIYEGRRVSVEGIPRTDPNTGFNFLQVAVIRPLDGPLGNDTITITFELDVECEPPAGTIFFAGASQQAVGLDDPDSDGTYTGTLILPAGFYDLGAFPVPVAILSGTPEDPQQTIKEFGEVVLEDGDNFSANVSFCDDGSSNNGSDDSGSETKATPKTKAKDSDTEVKAGAKELPNTGGAALAILGMGTLMLTGGLLVRRANR